MRDLIPAIVIAAAIGVAAAYVASPRNETETISTADAGSFYHLKGGRVRWCHLQAWKEYQFEGKTYSVHPSVDPEGVMRTVLGGESRLKHLVKIKDTDAKAEVSPKCGEWSN